MSLNRYATRRDTTEQKILEALDSVGAQYLCLTTFDVLVLFRGRLTMLDCKTPRGQKGTFKVRPSQAKLVNQGWPLQFVTTPEEALHLIGAIR